MSTREDSRVVMPCYVVKVAGRVVEVTNKTALAHAAFNEAAVGPVELWHVGAGGYARLAERRVCNSFPVFPEVPRGRPVRRARHDRGATPAPARV